MNRQFGLAAACLSAVAPMLLTGCTGGGIRQAMHRATPGFMLSEEDRSSRDLDNRPKLNLSYAQWQEQLGQHGEARRRYDAVLKDDPKSVQAIVGLARLDQLAEKPQDAEAGYEKALRLRPNDPSVMAAVGQFYASQKRWPEATELLTNAVTAAPLEPVYKHQLAVVKTMSGDVDGGLAIFSKIVPPEEAHFNAAYLLRKQGHASAAEEQLEIALDINPDLEAAHAMLADLHDEYRGGSHRAAQVGHRGSAQRNVVRASGQRGRSPAAAGRHAAQPSRPPINWSRPQPSARAQHTSNQPLPQQPAGDHGEGEWTDAQSY